MTIAGLPMYDLPEVQWANDALWSLAREYLERNGFSNAPESLQRGAPVRMQWSAPDLVLSQCCGYDLVHGFTDSFQLLGTPCYRAAGCDEGHYRSFVVVRKDSRFRMVEDLRGAACVVNGFSSHSGANALRGLIAPLSRTGQFFRTVKVSGSHLNSLTMLASGDAEVMAVDCVLFALLSRYRPSVLEPVRVLCWTEAAPAPPYVTGSVWSRSEYDAIQRALLDVLADPRAAKAKEAIFLDHVTVLPLSAYSRMLACEAKARRAGYTELHAAFSSASAADPEVSDAPPSPATRP